MGTREESERMPTWVWVILGWLVSFRLISVLLLAAAILLPNRAEVGRWRRVFVCLFWLSLLSPVDVSVCGITGSYRGGGVHGSGPRLVRYVIGMPATTHLIARYGEFYSGGCCGTSVVSPRWILVLY